MPGASERTVVGEAALDAVRRFRNYPTKEVARYLVKHEPLLFYSMKQAELAVAYYRGLRGKALAEKCHTKVTKGEFKIPKSDARKLSPYRFPVTHGYGVVMADIHLPYHDERALETALRHAVKEGASDFAVVGGDLLDAYQLSRYVKDPRQRDFAGEIEMARSFLGVLEGEFGSVTFKLGNHEARFYDYLYRHAPSLLGVPGMTWQEMLPGVTIVDDTQEIGMAYSGRRQNLTVIHGHEFRRGIAQPVNAARGLFLRAKCCAIQGHLHQTSTHAEGRLDGTPITTWGLGCLCDLRPAYDPMAFTRWNHGFALLGLSGKEFRVENLRILDGRVY